MNYINKVVLKEANVEAIYNIFMYLSHLMKFRESETIQSIMGSVDYKKDSMNARDITRIEIIRNAVAGNKDIAAARLYNPLYSGNQLTACVFVRPGGRVSVVFKGTGGGEWIDNGEGLSGLSEENTYITYGKNGEELYRRKVSGDYATDQQTEALNYFLRSASVNNWDEHTHINVSGHSKGGNKAQFTAIKSGLVDACYSFDGQGFSPEAISYFKNNSDGDFERRCKNIMSFSSENDYVNVLGKRLMPEENVYYFKSSGGIHYMHSMVDSEGVLRPQCEQGILSEYAESVSEDIMKLKPWLRQYATIGVMSIFQKYLGDNPDGSADKVSFEKRVAGMGIAVGALLRNIGGIRKIYNNL